MKALLDANVLFPTVLRAVLLGVAARGLYRPLWSPRITEEWCRAAARHGPAEEIRARGEAAALAARWPEASVRPREGTERRLWLPDPNDVHVLAAAIDGGAEVLVTLNMRDFPRGECRAEGVEPVPPDAFLMDLWLRDGSLVEAAAEAVRAEAERLSGEAVAMRPLLKRARLPRLGRALG